MADKDKDNEEVEATIADESVVIKYKTAGEIANRKSKPTPPYIPGVEGLSRTEHLLNNDFLMVVDNCRRFSPPARGRRRRMHRADVAPRLTRSSHNLKT